MLGTLGGFVDELHRLAVGPLVMTPDSAEGSIREVTQTELQALAALFPGDRSAGTRAEEQRDASASRGGGKRTQGHKKRPKHAPPATLTPAEEREAAAVEVEAVELAASRLLEVEAALGPALLAVAATRGLGAATVDSGGLSIRPDVEVHTQAGGKGLQRKFVVLTSPCCIHLAAALNVRRQQLDGESPSNQRPQLGKAVVVDAAELAAEVVEMLGAGTLQVEGGVVRAKAHPTGYINFYCAVPKAAKLRRIEHSNGGGGHDS